MSNTIFITANWTTGALSQQTISRQYDNNRYAVQFIGYPEGDGTEELDLYLLVLMSTAPGQKPGEITPIQLNSDQWYISNYFTQQVQVIKFQLCVLNEAGTYEAHSPIFSGRIGDSLEHDGTSQDIDVSTLFDAYREYLNELIIGAGAVIIDPVPTQGSTNVVSSGGMYDAIHDTDATFTQSGKAADSKAVGDKFESVKNKIDINSNLFEQGFKTVKNLLYTDGEWVEFTASGELTDSGVIVTALSDGAKYPSYQFFIDVTDIDSVTLSFASITQGEGTNARIRYGKEDSTGTAWLGFATSPCTIDTSAFYTLKIAFYVFYNKASVAGTSATFNRVQLEVGTQASTFVAGGKVTGLQNLGTGNTAYQGERLQIGQLDSFYKCNITVWKNFLNDTEHNLHQNQSIATYGNYVFILLNGGTTHIIAKTTKEIIGTMTLNVSNNHQNSAQFIEGVYAEDGDEFPIIMISRCGNASTSSTSPLPGTDAALMARIQKDGDNWSITNIGTIALDVTTWGSSWAVDISGKRLINISYQNGTYSVINNNPVVITVFNIPTKDKYTGHTLILKETDVIAKAYLEHFTLQALYAHGDLLYIPAKTSNGNYLYVFSISRNAIITIVPLESVYEPEGMMIMDNALYVSMRQGTDSAGVNPLRIYEITN